MCSMDWKVYLKFVFSFHQIIVFIVFSKWVKWYLIFARDRLFIILLRFQKWPHSDHCSDIHSFWLLVFFCIVWTLHIIFFIRIFQTIKSILSIRFLKFIFLRKNRINKKIIYFASFFTQKAFRAFTYFRTIELLHEIFLTFIYLFRLSSLKSKKRLLLKFSGKKVKSSQIFILALLNADFIAYLAWR